MIKEITLPPHGQAGQPALNIERIAHLLGRGKEKRTQGGWLTLCPCHEDHDPSLSLTYKNGKVLAKCFAGCPQEKVIFKMREMGLWTSSAGITLEQLAEAKCLDVMFLQSVFKLKSVKYQSRNAVLIPYFDERNSEVSKRFRVSFDGGFLWARKAKIIPYGLWLQSNQESDFCIIVEGESDTWTLTRYGLPVLGIPGKTTFKPEWKKYFKHYSRLFIWKEPDAPDFPERIAKHIKHAKIFIIDPERVGLEGIKDPSALHIYCVEHRRDFKDAFDKVLELAEPYEKPKKKAQTKGQKENIKRASFFVDGDCIYEQLLDNNKIAFIKYEVNKDKYEIVTEIIAPDGNIIAPYEEDEILSKTVLLPTGLEEFGSINELLSEVQSFIHRYLDVSELYEKIATYYVLLSYIYDKYNTLPYLRALGDTGCGKSRFLDVIGTLCYKSSIVSGALTIAAIFRLINKYHGTLVIDEADITNSDEYNEAVKLLNCGFERNRPIIRSLKEQTDTLKIYDVYGPKVFATRRRFKDPALEARCLTEIMKETRRTDIPEVLTDEFYRQREKLRNKLTLFRLRNLLKANKPGGLDLDVEPRLRQIAFSFGSMFADDPIALTDFKKFILTHQQKLIEERAETLPGQVVNVIYEWCNESALFATHATYATHATLAVKTIAEKINAEPRSVGKLLRTLGIETVQKKLDKNTVNRVVKPDLEHFKNLFLRYVPGVRVRDGSMSSISSMSSEYSTRKQNSEFGSNLLILQGNPRTEVKSLEVSAENLGTDSAKDPTLPTFDI